MSYKVSVAFPGALYCYHGNDILRSFGGYIGIKFTSILHGENGIKIAMKIIEKLGKHIHRPTILRCIAFYNMAGDDLQGLANAQHSPIGIRNR